MLISLILLLPLLIYFSFFYLIFWDSFHLLKNYLQILCYLRPIEIHVFSFIQLQLYIKSNWQMPYCSYSYNFQTNFTSLFLNLSIHFLLGLFLNCISPYLCILLFCKGNLETILILPIGWISLPFSYYQKVKMIQISIIYLMYQLLLFFIS